MAKLDKIQFITDVAIAGNLNVQGTSTVESSETILTKEALHVINSDNNALEVTLMGTIFRTGKQDTAGNYIDYAVVYDPIEESFCLGIGVYDDVNNTFQFNEGEGHPLAIRELTTDDDGYLIMWDADTHCFVRSPLLIGAGTNSVAGVNSEATGFSAFALGHNAHAIGDYSHAEGVNTYANGERSHAEGIGTIADGVSSHTEGDSTIARGNQSHAEGGGTKAIGIASHAEGNYTYAYNDYSHAEGTTQRQAPDLDFSTMTNEDILVEWETKPFSFAGGYGSHVEGESGLTLAIAAHAEGSSVRAIGAYSHAEGQLTIASSEGAHAEGRGTMASGAQAHAEGHTTEANGDQSHAEGRITHAIGDYSHAEGYDTEAIELSAHAEGNNAQ